MEPVIITNNVDVLLLGKLREGVDKLSELLLQIAENRVLRSYFWNLGGGLVVLPDDLVVASSIYLWVKVDGQLTSFTVKLEAYFSMIEAVGFLKLGKERIGTAARTKTG